MLREAAILPIGSGVLPDTTRKELARYLSVDYGVGERTLSMCISRKITLYVTAMIFCMAGCTYQRKVDLAPTGLPEEIYVTPEENSYFRCVGIFKFREPSYPRGMGRVASEFVYEELLRNKAFVSVTLETDVSDIRQESLVKLARDKGYDLIVTGELLYYFDGSLHQPSRVDERIRVIDVHTKKTLWYAQAMDIGKPAPYTDRILRLGRGARAPTARTLLKRNAEKFCRMLLSLPPQDFSASAHKARCLDPKTPKRASVGLDFMDLGLGEKGKARPVSASLEEFFNEQIYFEFDKSRLLPEAKEILRRKAEWLKTHSGVSVVIEGHCDERGADRYNMALGNQRAQSTKDYLVELGIVTERLNTVTYGEDRPAVSDHNETAWARNRRAEFLMEARAQRGTKSQ